MLSEAWIDFASGWISGGVSVLVIQPIDTVLTRLQASTAKVAQPCVQTSVVSASKSAAAVSLRPSAIARSMISDFGLSSLWRGSSAMIGAVPLQNALLMTGYGVGKRFSFGDDETDGASSSNVLCGVFVGGCTGGVLQSFVMSPVELIKVSQQVKNKPLTAATTTVAASLHTPLAWKGLGATLLRDGIPHGVWFVSYDYCKTKLSSMEKISNKDIAVPMLSGTFAATMAWLVGYPFDLIKTRIQAGNGKGVILTAQDLVNEANGRVVYGLYRGFGLKLLRSIPASAIGFLTYETVAKILANRSC
ncbi:hypothetical protein ACHAWO_008812 [Cyclotella atomus]|uniref:Mitochondrial carrier protein n=1 Tax=Cyclotella atomus TaxID=382360 RepID=A0ABD3NEE0_9STRA